MEEMDVNKIVANVIENEINSIFDILHGSIEKTIKEISLSFNKYLTASYKRLSKTKTLLYKDAPVNIDSIFVEPILSLQKKNISIDAVINNINKINRLLFSAPAGAGKSFLAKKIFLKIIESGGIGIPVFVELRELNGTDDSVFNLIENIFNTYNLTLTDENIDKLLSKGKFILILDGYDEIESKIRKKIDKEVECIIYKYQKTPVLITSRPDDEIEMWNSIYVIKVQPLTSEKAIELVKKLDYDKKIKQSFLNQLEAGLYYKHESFLSNPLLLTNSWSGHGYVTVLAFATTAPLNAMQLNWSLNV